MADLNLTERRKLETFLGSRSGYIWDFSHRTLQEFVHEATGKNIQDLKYGGGSKGALVRSFFSLEPNHIVAKLIIEFGKYWTSFVAPKGPISQEEFEPYQTAMQIAEKLKSEIAEHIDALDVSVDDSNFNKLKKNIIELIEAHRPEEAIDRLHTFTVRYIRELITKHGENVSQSMALHALLGRYKNILRSKSLIKTDMTGEILDSLGKVFEKFNHVRNNQSFAHPGDLLGYNESLYIFKVVSSSIEFIESIEPKIDPTPDIAASPVDELPF